MICYRDMTFCSSDCVREDCPRYFSMEHKEKAIEVGLPIAWSDFSESCVAYTVDKGEEEV